MNHSAPSPARLSVLFFSLLIALACAHQAKVVMGQTESVPVDSEMVESLLKEAPPAPTPNPDAGKPSGIDLLSLITRGGAFMIPIGVTSMLVVTLIVERLLMLRRKRIIPRALTDDLEEMLVPVERFNPAAALAICREHPSPAANAVEAMLMRTGQPLSEIEKAANESIQRDADDFAGPIRWVSLASSATPLMGLLGTVWGMIIAFHESTTLTPDRSRSEQLSEGIYTALITTLAGLIVAIPAAICAQFLENRLAKLFHRIERFTFDLAPGLARFHNRARLDADGTLRTMVPAAAHSASTPPNAPLVSSGATAGTAAASKPERVTR